MKKVKQLLSIIVMVIILCTVAPTQAFANTEGWVSNGQSWTYYTNGTMQKSSWIQDSSKRWYYLNEKGVMETGWVSCGGMWYYFNENGTMATDWILSGGKWYYLNQGGDMAVNTITEEGYIIGKDGAWTGEVWTRLGKTAIVPDSLFGTYEITINSVELTSDRNMFNDSNPAEVYKINYTYKLLKKGSATRIGLYLYSPFTAIDSTGEMGYSYPNTTNNDPQELNLVGSRCTADTFIAVKNKSDFLLLSLEYHINGDIKCKYFFSY